MKTQQTTFRGTVESLHRLDYEGRKRPLKNREHKALRPLVHHLKHHSPGTHSLVVQDTLRGYSILNIHSSYENPSIKTDSILNFDRLNVTLEELAKSAIEKSKEHINLSRRHAKKHPILRALVQKMRSFAKKIF